MMYLTTTARRKGAKRHIVRKSNDIAYLRTLALNNIDNKRYIVEIYNGRWVLFENFDNNRISGY